MIDQARTFAVEAHGVQKYGDKPYIHHLESVVNILEPYGNEAKIIGYLHDVVEDTLVSNDEVRSVFGDLVADCVAIVTDEPGINRKERKKKTYRKMSQVTGEETLALIVKAADRLANVQACLSDGNAVMLGKYQEEHDSFTRAVYRAGLCEDIWERLNQALKTSSP